MKGFFSLRLVNSRQKSNRIKNNSLILIEQFWKIDVRFLHYQVIFPIFERLFHKFKMRWDKNNNNRRCNAIAGREFRYYVRSGSSLVFLFNFNREEYGMEEYGMEKWYCKDIKYSNHDFIGLVDYLFSAKQK